MHSALTWVESSKLREEREERGRCWHDEDEDEDDKPDEEEVDKPEDEEHFSISPLFTLKSGVERREKAPESEDREEEEEEEEEWQKIVLSSSTFTSS